MDYIASLNMGSETMVMALAEVRAGYTRVIAVEQVASRGIERGRVDDKEQASSVVQQLLTIFLEKHRMVIDKLRVSLPAMWLKREMKRVSLTSSRNIKPTYLENLERQCKMTPFDDKQELVTILPVSYVLDGEEMRNPLNRSVKQGYVRYAIYSAFENEMRKTRAWLAELGITRVDFYAETEAMSRAVVAGQDGYRDFALIDLGADSTKVLVFREGVVVHDAELPLGGSAIDWDIHTAFSQDLDVARQLKHEHGSAIRVKEKNRKISIPNTKYSTELHTLLQIEQCRLEELLEGAIYQVQCSEFYSELSDGILLTGGGSRVKDVGILLEKLSGHQVKKALVSGVEAEERSWLGTPEYLTALGLLACVNKEHKDNWTPLKWLGLKN
jgi:cell division protein FtsA